MEISNSALKKCRERITDYHGINYKDQSQTTYGIEGLSRNIM